MNKILILCSLIALMKAPTTLAALQLDLNDILRADLMPTSFLLFDGGAQSTHEENCDEEATARQGGVVDLDAFSNASATPLKSTPDHDDGNFMDALSTMRFHR